MTQEDKTFEKILKYWPLIIGTVIVIAGWVNFGNADVNQSARISAIEFRQNKNIEVQEQIQVQLAQIQTDLSWIRKALISK